MDHYKQISKCFLCKEKKTDNNNSEAVTDSSSFYQLIKNLFPSREDEINSLFSSSPPPLIKGNNIFIKKEEKEESRSQEKINFWCNKCQIVMNILKDTWDKMKMLQSQINQIIIEIEPLLFPKKIQNIQINNTSSCTSTSAHKVEHFVKEINSQDEETLNQDNCIKLINNKTEIDQDPTTGSNNEQQPHYIIEKIEENNDNKCQFKNNPSSPLVIDLSSDNNDDEDDDDGIEIIEDDDEDDEELITTGENGSYENLLFISDSDSDDDEKYRIELDPLIIPKEEEFIDEDEEDGNEKIIEDEIDIERAPTPVKFVRALKEGKAKNLFFCYFCKKHIQGRKPFKHHFFGSCPENKNRKRKNKNCTKRSKRVKCKICEKIMTKQSYRSHKKTHKNNKKFECKFCPTKLSSLRNLKLHEERHEKNKKISENGNDESAILNNNLDLVVAAETENNIGSHNDDNENDQSQTTDIVLRIKEEETVAADCDVDESQNLLIIKEEENTNIVNLF